MCFRNTLHPRLKGEEFLPYFKFCVTFEKDLFVICRVWTTGLEIVGVLELDNWCVKVRRQIQCEARRRGLVK